MTFNPELITKARKGEIAILNDGDRDSLKELLSHIWPEDSASDNPCGEYKYYFKSNRTTSGGWWYWDKTDLPAHSVKDFYTPDTTTDPKSYLTEITKPQSQSRTYKVTRQQMKEIWEASNAENRPVLIRLIEQLFTPFESEITIDYNQFFSILRCFNQKEPDVLKKHFPEYFYIPEGEPVLCRDSKKSKWLVRVSDGNGGAYFEDNGDGSLMSCQYSEIIAFTTNPPK